MKKSLALTSVVATLFVGNFAYAAQNVANTSQKGSLLVFPLINVDHTTASYDTMIEVSNDATSRVHIECEYINEQKGRVNFDFDLTGKATASWDVYTLMGDHANPPPFPSNAGNPAWAGNPHRGELICFATDPGRQFQIPWNELTGTAVVQRFETSSGSRAQPSVSQPRQAFKYNAWAFAARCAMNTTTCLTGVATDNNTVSQGTPGTLYLSGGNANGAYDGCPTYNIANFMPNGSTLGSVSTIDNWLSVVSCHQDLRENYKIHATKLDFTVWNSNENSFTGAFACVDSIVSVPLGSAEQPSPPAVVQSTNFDYTTLQTANARFQVVGISATPPCPFPTESTGLLGVVSSSVALSGDSGVDQYIGNTTQTAGLISPAGYVLWDVSSAVPNLKSH